MGNKGRQASVSIEPKGLRVEFQGSKGPTHLIVPVLFPEGKHKDICIKVYPSSSVALANSVIVGDALQETFSRQHSVSAGGSFFAEASYSHTAGIDRRPYEVVYLSDFCGIRFQLKEYEVKGEVIGLQFAFPISKYDQCNRSEYFAEVSLEVEGQSIETHLVPRLVHPKAARILLLSGYTPEFSSQVFGHTPASQIAGLRLMYVTVTELHFFELGNLRQLLASGFDGIHLLTNVDSHGILVDDKPVPYEEFFNRLDGFGLKFLYIDTCNSVQVVSAFRKTDIGALIASTENLYVAYADDFERTFYQELGNGLSISQAFQSAYMKQAASPEAFPTTRSGAYNPMFLDLRRDFSFSASDLGD